MRLMLLTLLLLSFAWPASAADGVREISQAAVDEAGGFPFAIATPGSYVLTSNLTVASNSETAIDVLVEGVTIDLNGFTIRGPVVCTDNGQSTTTCSPIGIGDGVRSFQSNTTVRNGIIRGMGNAGISLLGNGSRIDSLIAVSNGQRGINVGASSTVEGSLAIRNGSFGFALGTNSVISQCSAVKNASDGIVTSFGGEISRNSSTLNGDGIGAGRGSVVSDNSISDNLGTGVFCTSGCLVNGNMVSGNGNVGLSLQDPSGYTNNVIVDHAIRPVQGGTYLSPNICDNTTASSVCDPP
jgi:hypothetical protein